MPRGSLYDQTEHASSTASATIQYVALISGQRAQRRAAGACIGSSLESRFSAQKVGVHTMSTYRPFSPRSPENSLIYTRRRSGVLES